MNDNVLIFAIFILAVVGIGIAWVDAWHDDEGEGDGDAGEE